MKIQPKVFRTLEDLKRHIRSHIETLFYSSCTSTVIPYANLGQVLSGKNVDYLCMGDLNALPQRMSLRDGKLLEIEGAVNWKDAKGFCMNKGRNVMVSPTEELAGLLAGIATSATGERSFGLGTLRDQVRDITYIDHNGVEQLLTSKRLLKGHEIFQSEEGKALLENYQSAYGQYKNFKNAPFPRLERETDLMVGMEGQLGVVTKATFATIEDETTRYLFIKLPQWEKDYRPHLEIFNKSQDLRNKVMSLELLDHNCLSYLPDEERPLPKGHDLIFLEIRMSFFDEVVTDFVSALELTAESDVFEINADKCHRLRMLVPRFVAEVNQSRGVKKKGTDVQVPPYHLEDLLKYYRDWGKEGVSYNLFGHFGDGHLHFNFLPGPDKEAKCQELLKELYHKVKELKGSPFAEHGIGLLKQDFISPFLSKVQLDMFSYLKEKMDPKNQFFPMGFLNLGLGRKYD
tara:strand:- start:491 stop:1867 length:1377 start_codon:yes stop_codon:yes gene_type:complete